MELKDFIKKVISDAIESVDEISHLSSRNVGLASRTDRRTIEFDVAVSAEETTSVNGKAGVRVLSFVEAGGNMGSEVKNSTISRITFGVDVDTMSKQEQAAQRAIFEQHRNQRRNESI
ncbi:MAG: hypothetical protein ACK4FA_00055 [Candidatus Paceibacteria bacterium]